MVYSTILQDINSEETTSILLSCAVLDTPKVHHRRAKASIRLEKNHFKKSL